MINTNRVGFRACPACVTIIFGSAINLSDMDSLKIISNGQKWLKFSRLAILCTGFTWLTIPVTAQTIEPIYAFTNSEFSSPRNPRADLVLGRDGNFYGTTEYGGSGGFGTVFKITTTGVLTVLANFDGNTTGGEPYGGVTLGTDGSYYGTTDSSGPGGVGTVFRVTTNGIITVIHSFSTPTSNGSSYTNGDGTYPNAGLTLGPDGCFYGVTSHGGLNGSGTVFRITTNGTLTTLFSFEALVASGVGSTNASGGNPYGRMVWGPDGNLYGTTSGGGSKSLGTLFKITTNGTFTTLVNFVGTNGDTPHGGLIAGPGGNLYGTTVNGGSNGGGTVFRLTTNGVLTTLVNFGYLIGESPEGGVTFGPDGKLYGTTTSGGTNAADSWGTVFRVTTNGDLTTLADFTNTNGNDPEGGLTLGPGGNFYGTTYSGGSTDPNAVGEIYRLNVGLAVPTKPSSIIWSAGTVILNLAAVPGSTNRLWATTNLNLPAVQWQMLATNVATNGFFRFTDTNASGYPVRFYRISSP